ncbi:MAG: M48 family metalloprotease [Deltaproteobacteria bacterium]|nr:M48 family metalloprotease [Deltaproteobacteria bacterium]
MMYEHVRVPLEQTLSEDLYRLFSGDIIHRLLREGRVESGPDELMGLLEGHSFRISERLAPRLDKICRSVQKSLAFEEPLEFFVVSSSEMNCSAVPRVEDDRNHLVLINSELLERFDEGELRFVLGHEIGHLLSRSADLQRIISFVFPEGSELPQVFSNKVELWHKLAELSADRFGFIASPDLGTCVRAFIKMASGLDATRLTFDPAAYIEEMERIIQYFHDQPATIHSAHPINPIRVKALQHFSDSALYRSVAEGGPLAEDTELKTKVDALLDLLLQVGHSELDTWRKQFIASGGLLVAGMDGALNLDEMDRIVGPLAYFTSEPQAYLREVLEGGKVQERFVEAVERILELNPSERYQMFGFLIDLVLADQDIDPREVDVLFQIGEAAFGLAGKEIAQQIGEAVQKNFVPRLSR